MVFFSHRAIKLPDIITFGEYTIPLIWKKNNRSKRFILKYSIKKAAFIITHPPKAHVQDLIMFVEQHKNWMGERFAKTKTPRMIAPYTVLPLRGTTYQLIPSGSIRGHVKTSLHKGIHQLIIPGAKEHFKRRVKEYLIKEARKDYQKAVHFYAKALKTSHGTITMRDTTSRWGSCSHEGNLSFSWRLIMAPPHILSSLAAHECAHLIEMNHSKAFWALVHQIDPHWQESKQWLRQYGADLHLYDFKS